MWWTAASAMVPGLMEDKLAKAVQSQESKEQKASTCGLLQIKPHGLVLLLSSPVLLMKVPQR